MILIALNSVQFGGKQGSVPYTQLQNEFLNWADIQNKINQYGY